MSANTKYPHNYSMFNLHAWTKINQDLLSHNFHFHQGFEIQVDFKHNTEVYLIQQQPM